MANYRPGIDLAEPNNQDRQRLREFMKLKYVDKRWSRFHTSGRHSSSVIPLSFRWAASQSDRAVRATVVDRTTGSRQGSVTASHTSQPGRSDRPRDWHLRYMGSSDLIDTTTAVDNAERSSMKTKHHKPRKNSSSGRSDRVSKLHRSQRLRQNQQLPVGTCSMMTGASKVPEAVLPSRQDRRSTVHPMSYW